MNNNNCIRNLLKYIALLQDNSNKDCNSLCSNNYNTRVIQLYKRNGDLLSINSSSYFRIMNVCGDCCTLLLLSNNSSTYSSLGEYVTIDCNCIGCVRCIEDISISGI